MCFYGKIGVLNFRRLVVKCMRCPKCQHNKSNVIDSRQAEDGNTIRRRRECDACHARFTTFERVEEVPLLVVKKTVL